MRAGQKVFPQRPDDGISHGLTSAIFAAPRQDRVPVVRLHALEPVPARWAS